MNNSDFKLPPDSIIKLPIDPDSFSFEKVNINKKQYDDAVNYGLFIYNQRIYSGFDSKEQNAKGQNLIAFNPISNFSIEVMSHMNDENDSKRLVQIDNVQNQEVTFEIQSNAFTTYNAFQTMVESFGNYYIDASSSDFKRLKKYLMDNMRQGTMVMILGHQNDEFWCFNNGVIEDGRYRSYDKNGCIEINGRLIYVPSANSLYKDNDHKFVNQKRCRYIQSGVSFEDWAFQMKIVHRDHGMLGVSFLISAVFTDYLFKTHGFFPLLFIYGEASTGKTMMIQSLQSLFGSPQPSMSILSDADSPKARIRKFAEFRNMLVFLEEYRATVDSKVNEWLKSIYNRIPYGRATRDYSFHTDNVPFNSSVAITGNDFPADDALITRCIIDEMHKSSFNEFERKEFDKLIQMLDRGISNCLTEIVSLRSYLKDNYKKLYPISRKKVAEKFGIKGIHNSRAIENNSVIYNTIVTLEDKLTLPFTSDQLLDYMVTCATRQESRRFNESEITRFWDIVLYSIRNQNILKDVHYKVERTDQNLIYVVFKIVYLEYAKNIKSIYNEKALPKNTLTGKLKIYPAFVTNKTVRIGSNVVKAWVFDLDKMEEEFKEYILNL